MSYPFNIRSVYNFDVYPTPVLGNSFEKVTVMSIMDYTSAIREADIPAIHANVYPYIQSQGIADDPSSYDYLKILTADGQTTILGIPWINLSTVVEVESKTITVVIENATGADVTRIRDALTQNGFNSLNITVK